MTQPCFGGMASLDVLLSHAQAVFSLLKWQKVALTAHTHHQWEDEGSQAYYFTSTSINISTVEKVPLTAYF